MKLYWIVTLIFNILGVIVSFSTYISPKGTNTNLVWLVLNTIGVWFSWQVLKAIVENEKESNEKK